MQTTEAVMEQPSTGIIRSIRMLWTLYVKDVRQLAGICLSMILLIHLIRNISWINYQIFMFGFPGYKMVFILPTILAYQLYVNSHNSIVYLQRSLPVSPGMTMLSLYTALMTYIWVYVVITTGIDRLAYVLGRHESYNEYLARFNEQISFWQMFIQAFLRKLSTSSLEANVTLLSGIVCLAAGIQPSSTGQSRLRYWAGFFCVLLLVIGGFALCDRFNIQWWYVFGPYTRVVLGVGFAAIGALLYNRFGEV